ncbi:SirB2 family protein [Vibrio maerlii]|uniref:SirB2 family protein n=1 Tax=Vibrio maerlii TaxID=2231648 RepID=UPI000E3B6687|nr:SirB2 family protein [Vibrio maerlii]
MYMTLKHSHFLFIALSVALFTLRFIFVLRSSPLLENKFIKVAPHAVDTVLFLTGIGLIMVTGFMPFTDAAPWMTTKLTGVLAYIALGFYTLKIARNNWARIFGFLGSLGWLLMAANTATSKVGSLFG